MVSDHDLETKSKKSMAAAHVGASLSSLLSGNPFSLDECYHRIRTYIENGRYTRNMQAFSVPCTKFEPDHKPYDTVVIKSSHGAYILVKTATPALDENGEPHNKPLYALLFSQYPALLQDMLLKPRNKHRNRPSTEETELKISVVAAHWESDIEQRNPETEEVRIVKSWVKTAISKHNTIFEENLKRHGAIMRDGAKMWRSGSSIFWLKDADNSANNFDVYYYSNPVYGQLSLFLTERALKNPVTRNLMQFFSVKLSDKPMSLQDADSFVSETYGKIAQGIFNNRDPYDITAPDDRLGKIGRLAKKLPVRIIQKMAHAVMNIDRKSFMVASAVGLTITASIWIVFSTFILAAGAVSQGVTNLGLRSVQVFARTAGRFMAPVKTRTVNALNDVSVLLAAHDEKNIITAENAGLILNPRYIDFMDPVQKPFLENTFPDMVPQTKQTSVEWAQGVLLDTLGIQPGTIFSDIMLNGRTFLLAQQPNGLDIYYDPEEHVAIAHIVRDPNKGFSLEKPIEQLFTTIPDEDFVIAIRHGDNNKIEMTSFPTLDNIPENFIRKKSKSIKEINRETIDLDLVGSFSKMGLYEFVTEKEADKWRKKAQEKVAVAIKDMFNDRTDILDERVDAYCLRQTHACAAGNIIVLCNTPPLPAMTSAQGTPQTHYAV